MRGDNLKNVPDHRRCVETVKDRRSKNVGARCPNWAMEGQRQCAFHRGVPQRAARLDAADKLATLSSISNEEVREQERAVAISEVVERQQRRDEQRQRLREADEQDEDDDPRTRERRLERVLADPNTEPQVREACEGKLHQLWSGEPQHTSRPAPIPGMWEPKAYSAHVQTGVSALDLPRRKGPRKERWKDIPLLGDR